MLIRTEGYEQDKNGDVDTPEKPYKAVVDTAKISFARIATFKIKSEYKQYCYIVFDNGEYIIVSEEFLEVYFKECN